jgi:hypothetical protein
MLSTGLDHISFDEISDSFLSEHVLLYVMSSDGTNGIMQVVLPYIAEENQGEDPEVQVKPDVDNATARQVKDAIYAARDQVQFTWTFQCETLSM